MDGAGLLASLRKRWVTRTALTAIGTYVLVFSIPLVLENAAEIAEHVPALEPVLKSGARLYQKIATASPRPVMSRFTALVKLSTDTLPANILRNACDGQREFLSRLLPRIAAARPSMIVLDFAFAAESCDQQQTTDPTGGTRHLVERLEEVAEQSPIVIGQVLEKGEDRVIKPSISIPESPRITYGLLVFNRDTRKVPLSWHVYRSRAEAEDDATEPKRVPTLALQAAVVYRSTFPDGGKQLAQLVETRQHPFTGFMPEEAFTSVQPLRLMCNAEHAAAQAWKSCADTEGDAAERDKLRGKIAVVGWQQDDEWDTVAGEMPGYIVNANYIEALLDDHYLKPVAFWWQLALSIVWVLLIELPFHPHWQLAKNTALLISLLIWLAVAFSVYYFAVVLAGYFTVLFVPSLVALLIRFIQHWYEDRTHRKEQAHGEVGKTATGPAVDGSAGSHNTDGKTSGGGDGSGHDVERAPANRGEREKEEKTAG
jgi:CHASE2 domain-containing sensor protein